MHCMRRTTDISGRHFARYHRAVPRSWREAGRRLRSGLADYWRFAKAALQIDSLLGFVRVTAELLALLQLLGLV